MLLGRGWWLLLLALLGTTSQVELGLRLRDVRADGRVDVPRAAQLHAQPSSGAGQISPEDRGDVPHPRSLVAAHVDHGLRPLVSPAARGEVRETADASPRTTATGRPTARAPPP